MKLQVYCGGQWVDADISILRVGVLAQELRESIEAGTRTLGGEYEVWHMLWRMVRA
jgi:hypothetical protein